MVSMRVHNIEFMLMIRDVALVHFAILKNWKFLRTSLKTFKNEENKNKESLLTTTLKSTKIPILSSN